MNNCLKLVEGGTPNKAKPPKTKQKQKNKNKKTEKFTAGVGNKCRIVAMLRRHVVDAGNNDMDAAKPSGNVKIGRIASATDGNDNVDTLRLQVGNDLWQ